MAGCGYVCPQCEGKDYTDDGKICDWCKTPTTPKLETPEKVIIENN